MLMARRRCGRAAVPWMSPLLLRLLLTEGSSVPTSVTQFTAYSCDTGPTTGSGPWAPSAGRSNETLTSFGGNVYSAIRLGHPRASATNPKPAPCNSYNASADPLGPCFTSPAEAKAYLGTIPAGHRAISLEGQPTLYTIQIGNLTVPRHLECFDPIADSVNGPWLDAWSETVHARFQKWFEEFHSLGGQVRGFALTATNYSSCCYFAKYNLNYCTAAAGSSLPLPLDSQRM